MQGLGSQSNTSPSSVTELSFCQLTTFLCKKSQRTEYRRWREGRGDWGQRRGEGTEGGGYVHSNVLNHIDSYKSPFCVYAVVGVRQVCDYSTNRSEDDSSKCSLFLCES